jgi:hypothetical protein
MQYCKSKPSTFIVKAHKVSDSTSGVKYKFGIRFSEGVKNNIHLDKNTVIIYGKKRLKQNQRNLHLQKFIVIDLGERISACDQKIPYHMVFDVKYDLRHKE